MQLNQKIGEELKNILSKPHDVIKIARWAEHIYANHCRELSPELDDLIMALSVMEHGPEFEYTEQELELIANMLINKENNPIKIINEMKSKSRTQS